MNNITERVVLMRDAGIIKRSHTCRTLMDRNVAEHSHGVAMLVLLIYQNNGKMPRAELLAAALSHDLSEIATGDIPAPVKRQHPNLKRELNLITSVWEVNHGLRYSLTPDESALLLWCDRMDFALYSLEELKMGNTFFQTYYGRIRGWLLEGELPNPDGVRNTCAELLSDIPDLSGEDHGSK